MNVLLEFQCKEMSEDYWKLKFFEDLSVSARLLLITLAGLFNAFDVAGLKTVIESNKAIYRAAISLS